MSDPVDPRYLLANERTFLAWIRTALGFLAAGTGLTAVELPWPETAVRIVAVGLVATAAVCAVVSYRRWRSVERAVLAAQPTPPARGLAVLTVAICASAVALTLLIVF